MKKHLPFLVMMATVLALIVACSPNGSEAVSPEGQAEPNPNMLAEDGAVVIFDEPTLVNGRTLPAGTSITRRGQTAWLSLPEGYQVAAFDFDGNSHIFAAGIDPVGITCECATGGCDPFYVSGKWGCSVTSECQGQCIGTLINGSTSDEGLPIKTWHILKVG